MQGNISIEEARTLGPPSGYALVWMLISNSCTAAVSKFLRDNKFNIMQPITVIEFEGECG